MSRKDLLYGDMVAATKFAWNSDVDCKVSESNVRACPSVCEPLCVQKQESILFVRKRSATKVLNEDITIYLHLFDSSR